MPRQEVRRRRQGAAGGADGRFASMESGSQQASGKDEERKLNQLAAGEALDADQNAFARYLGIFSTAMIFLIWFLYKKFSD